MKHKHMIFAVLVGSLGLNAMAPNVTKWQEICKNPHEKQELVTIYQHFCQKRLKNNIAWVIGSCAPFIFKSVRKYVEPRMLIGLFTLRQTYFLGRNVHRNQLVTQKDLSHLNHDVLEQLGNPVVLNNSSSFDVASYGNRGYSSKGMFGYEQQIQFEDLSVDNVAGIGKVLSGRYRVWEKGSGLTLPATFYLERKRLIDLIKDTIQ